MIKCIKKTVICASVPNRVRGNGGFVAATMCMRFTFRGAALSSPAPLSRVTFLAAGGARHQ